MKAKLVFALLLVPVLACKEPTGEDIRITGVNFRVFTNINHNPDSAQYFWLEDSTGWAGERTTPQGTKINLDCLNCPPGHYRSEDGQLHAGPIRLSFRVVTADSGFTLFEILDMTDENNFRRFGHLRDSIYYITIAWQCTLANNKPESICRR